MALIKLYILLGLCSCGSAGDYLSPHYDKGVMELVSRNRDMPVVPCMIASPTIPIGEWVWVWGRNTKVLRHCRITDTSEARDKARHIRLRRVELSYEAARALCGAAAMQEPPSGCPIIIIRLEE
jgi:hypothetical protein